MSENTTICFIHNNSSKYKEQNQYHIWSPEHNLIDLFMTWKFSFILKTPYTGYWTRYNPKPQWFSYACVVFHWVSTKQLVTRNIMTGEEVSSGCQVKSTSDTNVKDKKTFHCVLTAVAVKLDIDVTWWFFN